MYSALKMLANFIYMRLTDVQLESVIKVMSKKFTSNTFFNAHNFVISLQVRGIQ